MASDQGESRQNLETLTPSLEMTVTGPAKRKFKYYIVTYREIKLFSRTYSLPNQSSNFGMPAYGSSAITDMVVMDIVVRNWVETS